MRGIETSEIRRCSIPLRLCATLFLAAGSLSATHAQPPIERFRGAVLNTAPMPGITAVTRGRDVIAIRATEQGLLTVFGEDAVSKMRIKLLVLRVGAKLTEGLLPPCMDES